MKYVYLYTHLDELVTLVKNLGQFDLYFLFPYQNIIYIFEFVIKSYVNSIQVICGGKLIFKVLFRIFDRHFPRHRLSPRPSEFWLSPGASDCCRGSRPTELHLLYPGGVPIVHWSTE